MHSLPLSRHSPQTVSITVFFQGPSSMLVTLEYWIRAYLLEKLCQSTKCAIKGTVNQNISVPVCHPPPLISQICR